MNTKILFITLLVICFASCIPSLHPIFTEKNRIVDDRIVGNWISDSSIDIQIKTNLKIDSNEEEEIDRNKVAEEIKNSILKNDGEVRYRFERSTTITYVKGNEKDGKGYSKIKLPFQRLSIPKKKLLKKGYKVSESTIDPYYILTYAQVDNGELVEDVMLVNLTKINGDIYMNIHPHQDFKRPSRFETNYIPANTFAKIEFINSNFQIKQFDSEYIEKLIKAKKVRLKHETINDQIILTASTEDLRSFIQKYGNDKELYEEAEELTAALN